MDTAKQKWKRLTYRASDFVWSCHCGVESDRSQKFGFQVFVFKSRLCCGCRGISPAAPVESAPMAVQVTAVDD